MTSAYQQQLAQQLRAAEDELGKRRRQAAQLTEQVGQQRNAIRWALRMIRRAEARHQSTIVQARRQAARAEQAEADRDGAYRERAHLTAWLATIHPAVITPATDIDDDGWQLLYLTVGGRQLSWHIHPRDAELYAHVEHVPADDPRAQWDGHTTEQKYEAIQAMTFGELRGQP
ncbi:hypothetical protein ACFZDG_18355 [Kitasatospora xanthocidica]|uniref:hypothetical protein n=1 Tax=Kitasatospora xanthocidica TaxID=83382 RepID=UPI0036F04234